MVKPTQPIPHGRGVSGVNRWPGQPRRETPRRSQGYNRWSRSLWAERLDYGLELMVLWIEHVGA